MQLNKKRKYNYYYKKKHFGRAQKCMCFAVLRVYAFTSRILSGRIFKDSKARKTAEGSNLTVIAKRYKTKKKTKQNKTNNNQWFQK